MRVGGRGDIFLGVKSNPRNFGTPLESKRRLGAKEIISTSWFHSCSLVAVWSQATRLSLHWAAVEVSEALSPHLSQTHAPAPGVTLDSVL